MGKNKLKHFEENKNSPNLIEIGKENFGKTAGRWPAIFGNTNPITLEVGCGKGEYTTGLAELFPDRNFIGSDIKGSRLYTGSQQALIKNLRNAVFLRTKIEQIEAHFAPGEISNLWITFPDPKPRVSDSKRRLTSAAFLSRYKRLLAPGGLVQFKTDDRPLFDFTLDVLKAEKLQPEHLTFDFYQSEYRDLVHGLMSTYEKKFVEMGKKINYVAFRLA